MQMLGQILEILIVVGCAYWLMAAWLVSRYGGARTVPLVTTYPSVTILKPLYGAEPNLAANLTSFIQQDYPAPIQVIFGVQSQFDKALPIVRSVMDAFPNRDLTLVVNSQRHGENPKISNLINMMPQARSDIILIADSDIGVDAAYVSRVVAELDRPNVGAVTCAYYGAGYGALWSRLMALAIDSHFLPNVVVGLALKLATPCFGATIALKRETLEMLGGFQAFTDVLADDYAIGEAVRRLGRQVIIPAFLVGHTCSHASFVELVAHEIRWAKTIANVDRAGFLGTGITHVIPLSLTALAIGGATERAALLVAASLLCRYLLLWSVARRFNLTGIAYWLLPVRDCLSFCVYLASFLPFEVRWKGDRFLVKMDGTMARRPESE
ncbi:bacteriohopanetetrol glucosamine biosynthesis glycosyltransferase HpnI [Methylovirgula sp. 4M-Z18]|uniref:bacteriohopanetetrol glucosamine biosynthesis glycosyltransferase HpnI n=1 Tax=Methylovirgula sp. 4M-Z18 TaxID=2293567 RepID=UPI000E2F6A5B|nr:bacteriohopanetetrol glucosamine biosynthesis glycosyltransferase HpnI [Methylovirgula sp. 4M-Z18]RFB76416.1 glycosyltransferase [Methylovirgula sp. 4M-Z18]